MGKKGEENKFLLIPQNGQAEKKMEKRPIWKYETDAPTGMNN